MSENEPKLTVIHIAIAVLNIYPSHARRHDNRKLNFLIKSIREFGLMNPIIIDELDTILSGHLRARAYEELGLKTIPAIRVTHLSPDQKSAFVIAANRITELGDWDESILKQEFQILTDMSCDLDLEMTGFALPEIDLIIQSDDFASEEEPEVSPPPSVPRTQPGDIYQLGAHRLTCGSCLDRSAWQALMQDDHADACFTDPPYNVPNKGHVTSKDHADFAMAHGEMSPAEYTSFLRCALSLAAEFSRDGALHYVCIDHGHLRELYGAADQVYARQLNLIVWNKTNGGMGSFYRSRHELIPLFKVGVGEHVNNVQLGKFGRNRSNVWTYEGANTFRRDRNKDLSDHPTVKPLAMVADALLDSTHLGDVVIDGFGGSGTLILAAERTGRRARVIEYEPKYCDVAIRRWEEMTGETAVLISSGSTLALPAPQTLLLPPPAEGGVNV